MDRGEEIVGGGVLFGRVSWDEYWLGVASAVGVRGDCAGRKVGAVLVDNWNRLVGSGYNGTRVRGEKGCSDGVCEKGRVFIEYGREECRKRFGSYLSAPDSRVVGCDVVHAEVNCIGDYLDRVGWCDFEEMTLYVTDKPCGDCNLFLKEVGVGRVVW